LGEATYPLSNLKQNVENKCELVLHQHNNKKSGRIFVSLKAIGFGKRSLGNVLLSLSLAF
jgi:hypothetical protein